MINKTNKDKGDKTFHNLLPFLFLLKIMAAIKLFGRIRRTPDKSAASLPGTIINLWCSIWRTANSPTASDLTAIFLPNDPIFSRVSFSIAGFVNTGPGQRQLTE